MTVSAVVGIIGFDASGHGKTGFASASVEPEKNTVSVSNIEII